MGRYRPLTILTENSKRAVKDSFRIEPENCEYLEAEAKWKGISMNSLVKHVSEETKHNDAAGITFRPYPDQNIRIEEHNGPSHKTLMNILESLVVCGNLRRTDLHRRSSISYAKLIEYIEWLKLKELIVENGSYVSITERGRMLYSYLA